MVRSEKPNESIRTYVMAHPYPIREIARQAGVSEATVDRVLHARGGVRQSTVDEVRRAIADLHRQRSAAADRAHVLPGPGRRRPGPVLLGGARGDGVAAAAGAPGDLPGA